MPDASTRDQANILLGEAVRFRAQHRLREGIAKCLDAIKLDTENTEAFEILGDLYSESNLYQAAIEAYRRALEIIPSQPHVEKKLARTALLSDAIARKKQMADDLLAGRLPKRAPRRSPAVVGLLSLVIPGLGQLANQQVGKAVVCVILWMITLGTSFSAASEVVSQQRPSSGLDLFGLLAAFFMPPALWWTLLQAIVYGYSVIDAAVAATQAASRDDDGW
jgi:tetratricopeptide (TPR) repeat protein